LPCPIEPSPKGRGKERPVDPVAVAMEYPIVSRPGRGISAAIRAVRFAGDK
jgi:hypothetical protein